MAFSAVTERGSANERSTDTAIVVSPSADLTVGKIVFVYVVCDNTATTAGASTTHSSVADTDGNTWAKVYERTQSAGVAADGATASLWWCKVATQIDTTDVITATVASTFSKVIMVFEVTVGAGATIQIADDGTPSAFQEGNVQFPSVATSGMTSQPYLFIGSLGLEEENVAWTEDADYTNVFASEGVTSGPTGVAVSNVVGFLGYRIATLTGDTFAPGLGAARDLVCALVAFEEVAGGTTVTPATIAVTASLPTPSILAASLVTPTVIAAVAALPTPTVAIPALVTPAVIPAVAALPTPTILAAAKVTPAVIAALAALPTPSILAASLVTPATIATIAALPTPAILAASSVLPATIAALVTLPTPTIDVAGGTTTVFPATIAALVSLPTPQPIVPALVTPTVIAATVALPTPTILVAPFVNPATIAVVASLPTPTVSIPGLVSPAVIAVVVALPTPTIVLSAVVLPATIAVLVTLPTPTVTLTGTVFPATIAVLVTLPTPTIVIGAVTFWTRNPVGYTVNPAAFTRNPAGFVKVGGGDDPPW